MPLIAFEAFLGGVLIAGAVWELVSLRRLQRRDAERAAQAAAAAPLEAAAPPGTPLASAPPANAQPSARPSDADPKP